MRKFKILALIISLVILSTTEGMAESLLPSKAFVHLLRIATV